MKKITAIIVAAGKGQRFGTTKQSCLLAGKPVLNWSLERFQAHPKVSEIILVLGKEMPAEKYSSRYGKISAVVPGGKERQDSVIAGFSKLDPGGTDIVLIHDGVRPLVSEDLISRVIAAARENRAAVPVIPLEDTIKKIRGDRVLDTMDRDGLGRVQTPQGFDYSILKSAFEKAVREEFFGTDEASLVEKLGQDIIAVPGEQRNIKLTTPLDLKIAEVFLAD